MADDASDQNAFFQQMAEYGGLTNARLLDLLPQKEPFDHLYGPIRDYLGTSGKGFRPSLMLATCRAFGGDIERALTSASALELLHNAFLIHDDIEDLSDFRRGRPCMHTRLGVPLAINVGDAMQAQAMLMLHRNVADLGPETSARIVEEFQHLLVQSLEGQAMELGWVRDNAMDVAPADYLRMSLKKTCWYSFIHPCRIGALIARPDEVARGDFDLDRFNAFGFFLGAAFQIQDDVLNLIGSKADYGKEIGGDIYEGKRTLMLSRLTSLSGEQDRGFLTDLLGRPRSARSEQDISDVLAMMRSHDCISYAQTAAHELVESAKREFQTAFEGADPGQLRFFDHFLDYMISRNA